MNFFILDIDKDGDGLISVDEYISEAFRSYMMENF